MLKIYCDPPSNVIPRMKIYDSMFSLYKTDILNLLKLQWKQEDINGDSDLQLHITTYFFAFTYIMLLLDDYESGLYTNQQLIDKYNVESAKTCFACYGISIDKLLEIAEIDLELSTCLGINTLGIAYNWSIGEKDCLQGINTLVTTQTSVQAILASTGLIVLINSEC